MNLESTKKRVIKYRSTDEYKIKHAESERMFRKTGKGKEIKYRYEKKRYKSDIQYRLRTNLRRRFLNILRKMKLTKKGITKDLLGCSWLTLKTHLEKKFYNRKKNNEKMSWENYGKWHIDHIRPISKFNLLIKTEQFKACNYKNLQPLWAEDNIEKSDSINLIKADSKYSNVIFKKVYPSNSKLEDLDKDIQIIIKKNDPDLEIELTVNRKRSGVYEAILLSTKPN